VCVRGCAGVGVWGCGGVGAWMWVGAVPRDVGVGVQRHRHRLSVCRTVLLLRLCSSTRQQAGPSKLPHMAV
jgi:hypothetical protein